jgi:hypothetical protein
MKKPTRPGMNLRLHRLRHPRISDLVTITFTPVSVALPNPSPRLLASTLPLLRGMVVRLTDDAPVIAAAQRMAELNGLSAPPPGWVRVKAGELGIVTISEGEVDPSNPELAECRFADCQILVDRSMVEVE